MSEKDQKSFGNYKKFFCNDSNLNDPDVLLDVPEFHLNSWACPVQRNTIVHDPHNGICNDDSYAGFYAEYV